MDFGVFEVASYSPSESQLRKEAARDKLAAATYDVRHKFGSYLFQADSPQGFDDRAKLMYADICKTIEPHLHARTGVYSRVMKALKKEWKTAVQTEDTMAQVTDQSVASSQAGRGPKPPAPPKVHTHQPQLIGRVACYPGCHEDEAHAKKFHKKDDEKEARRRRANGYEVPDSPDHPRHQSPDWEQQGMGAQQWNDAGRPGWKTNNPSVQQDPDRAHQVLDHTHQKVDEHAQKQHQIVDQTHNKVDERSPMFPGYSEHPADTLGRDLLFDPAVGGDAANYGTPQQGLIPQTQGEFNRGEADAYHDMQSQRDLPPDFGLHQGSYRYADDGAFAEHAPDHPEMHIQETYERHNYEPLKPEGDFDAYKDSVDQGAPSKINHDFTAPDPSGTSPATVVHHDDDGGHNFVPRVTGSRTFQALSRLIQAEVPVGAMPPDAGMGAGIGSGTPGVGGQPMSSAPAMDTSSTPAMSGGGASVVQSNRSYYSQLSAMLKQSAPPLGAPAPAAPPPAPGAPGGAGDINLPSIPNPFGSKHEESADSPVYRPGPTPPATGANPWVGMPGFGHEGRKKASGWALKQIQEVGTKEARIRLLAVCRSHGILTDRQHARIANILTKKTADSNYLQKADEALTKVLNEKAEEFQNTIAPLQQALITIQQAEQLANPLNVSPPAGTVNALPGQQGAGAAATAASGGGVGMGVQPAAAGLAGQPATQALQQTARRRRGGNPKGRRLS